MKNIINRILTKIGLVTRMNLELNLTPETVVENFSKKVDKDRHDLFDYFTFNKLEYKGTITTDQFNLKKSKSFFVSFEHFAQAKGTFNSKNGRLVIDAEIFASQRYSVFIGFTLTALLFTGIALVGFTSFILTHELDGLYAGITLLIFETVFLGLPTLAMKRSVSNLKSELATELTNIRKV